MGIRALTKLSCAGATRRVRYDPEADALYIELRPEERVVETEDCGDILLDLGEGGGVVGIEILRAGEVLAPLLRAGAGSTR